MEASTEYLFRRYDVTLEFLAPIAGGTPLNKGMISDHIARFSAGVSNALKLSKKQEGEVSEEAMQKYMLACSSGFPLDNKGIYVRGFQLNAMLKDAAQRMKATMKQKGLSNTIRDGGLLFPQRLYLGVEPSLVERPVKPDNGPSNIKIFQTAEVNRLSFPCAVLENGDLSHDLFQQMWIVAQGIGLGANRHLGYGVFELVGLEQVGDWNIANLFRNGHLNGAAPSPVDRTAGIPQQVAAGVAA